MLTEKQGRFCQEYVVDLNATQAAIRAGYSPRTAAQQAARLLTKVKVQEEIQRRQAAIGERLEVTADRVVLELARIAFFDIRKLYDDRGRLRDPKDLDDNTARAISSIEAVELPTAEDQPPAVLRKIRAWDKKGALELLGKHLGILTDKLKVETDERDRVIIVIDDNGRDPELTQSATPIGEISV